MLSSWSGRRAVASASARGADEGADFVRIFFAGRALDAGRHIDAGRARDAQRLGDIARIEPARQHERHAGIDALSSVQSNGLPSPPGRVASCGARASKISRSATCAYWRIGERSARSAIGSAFITGRPKRRAHRRDALRRLLAVQLQHVGLERVDDVAQRVVVGIDRERDLAGPATHALAERARGLQPEVARARRQRTRSRPGRRRNPAPHQALAGS